MVRVKRIDLSMKYEQQYKTIKELIDHNGNKKKQRGAQSAQTGIWRTTQGSRVFDLASQLQILRIRRHFSYQTNAE